MTTSGGGKVIVRVEVVIEGLSEPAKASEPPRQSLIERGSIKPLAIDPFPDNVPGYLIGGVYCMEASGTSPLIGGVYAQVVKAMAYPMPGITTTQSGYQTPPANAVVDTPAGNQNWSFTRAKNNAVPGGKFDNILNGSNNSSLLLWYFYGGSSLLASDSCSFHGYVAGSGSAFGSAIVRGGSGPAVFHASFAGALASLGTVALVWNGVSWAGISSSGSAVLSFCCHEGVYQLTSAGPATSFIVAAHPRSHEPFSWAAEGTGLGALAGPFGVTVVE